MWSGPWESARRAKLSGVPGPLTPDVKKLGWVSFWADVSSESVYPLIPVFLSRTLGAPAMAIGGIEGIANLTVALLRLVAGRASDRAPQRKPIVFAGYLASGLAKPALALEFSPFAVMAIRVLDRFGKGIRSPARDAMLADFATPETRGAVFGFHRAMDSAGAFAGSLLALALVSVGHFDPRTVFLFAGIPGALAALWVLSVREKRREIAVAPPSARAFLPAEARPLVAPLICFGIANSTDMLLQGTRLGLNAAEVIGAYILYNAVYAGLSYPLGRLSDRVGRRKLIVSGWVLYAVVYAAVGMASVTGFWVLMAFYGLYMALTDGASKALIADYAPAESRGAAMGTLAALGGLGSLVGGIAAGLLIDRVNPAAGFGFGAVFAIIAAALLPRGRRRSDDSPLPTA
jgi:MFS family permease